PQPVPASTERLPVKNTVASDEEYVIEKPSLRPFGSPLPKHAADLPRPAEEPRAVPEQETKTTEKAGPDGKTVLPDKTKEAPAKTAAPAEPECRPLRFVGEVFGTYILLESADELVFIDKHAAHERILYEKLRAQQGERYAQQLLSPVTVTMDKESYSALLAARGQLLRAGFELEDFGGGTILVRSAPLSFGEQDITDALFEIAAHLQENRRDLSTEHDDWLLHNIACRAAIKGGDRTSDRELTALAQQLYEHPEIRYCPHGRPVYLSMKKRELEKQFGRIQ
ncbi:MAG: DNA mismatch repair protein MutL, partial [Firmicutes bacterium]|nr:DNA mismatch repair protein MutL [Bacillota bacterium]